MQQGSILPFLQKAKSSRTENSRSENSRPGQPYQQRPNSSRHHSRPNSTGQHRGPNRRRNMDLKAVADETKAELPKVLSSITGFDAAESSVYDLKHLGALDPNACPDFVLPHGDTDAGKKGTRIRVYDMDTFDVALHLAPNYKVHTHLGLSNPSVSKGSTTKPDDGDIVMEDAGNNDTQVQSKDNTTAGPDRDSPTKRDDGQILKPEETTTAKSAKDSSKAFNLHLTASNGRPVKPVAVLNLASERSPGGGWQNGALAQEECLCYRSSLYLSLHKTYYPLPSLSAIYTPSVVLIRDAMSCGHTLLTPTEAPANLPITSVISVAALRKPQLTDDKQRFKNVGQRAETKRKIRVTLRVAARQGHTKLVLGALGCGVFANPPKEVAECFLEVLREKEFQGGWWEEVGFAVLDNVKGTDGGKDGNGNFGVFYRVLDGEIV
ncbi:hypothetical protein N0V83_008420 [Neocucurbitaria cava]|uniref:Microbial-type PARG catalytic domain-containing protein n=1 Tax=Neocucurbitaria cava TaxID=798079 RepID=A0A9W8Y1Y7_9PLEO|nr:hypothetical protein N0V83_008420 [Neocucurbitaria cava]